MDATFVDISARAYIDDVIIATETFICPIYSLTQMQGKEDLP